MANGGMIRCQACGEESFLRREPVYDGFKKTGETLSCTGCGHEFAAESEIEFIKSAKPQIFSESDRSKKVKLFASDELGRNCRHCKHYVVNPFVQRCGLHQVEVEATDCCPDFAAKGSDDGDDPLARLLKKE